MRAICKNDIQDVKEIIDEGFDLDSVIDYKYGYTPMILASVVNHPGILYYLALKGANVDK